MKDAHDFLLQFSLVQGPQVSIIIFLSFFNQLIFFGDQGRQTDLLEVWTVSFLCSLGVSQNCHTLDRNPPSFIEAVKDSIGIEHPIFIKVTKRIISQWKNSHLPQSCSSNIATICKSTWEMGMITILGLNQFHTNNCNNKKLTAFVRWVNLDY